VSARQIFSLDDHAQARLFDPETSHEAADTVQVTRGQAIVLDTFTNAGRAMTDVEAWAYLQAHQHPTGKLSPSGFRSRRAELVANGTLEFSGTFGTTPSGRKTRIWRLKEKTI